MAHLAVDIVVIDELVMEYYTIKRDMIETDLFMVNVRVVAKAHADHFFRGWNLTNKL